MIPRWARKARWAPTSHPWPALRWTGITTPWARPSMSLPTAPIPCTPWSSRRIPAAPSRARRAPTSSSARATMPKARAGALKAHGALYRAVAQQAGQRHRCCPRLWRAMKRRTSDEERTLFEQAFKEGRPIKVAMAAKTRKEEKRRRPGRARPQRCQWRDAGADAQGPGRAGCENRFAWHDRSGGTPRSWPAG